MNRLVVMRRVASHFKSCFFASPRRFCSSGGGGGGVLKQLTPMPKLSDQLTQDLKDELAGDSTGKKFKLAAISEEVSALEMWEFPMPESLTEDQWRNLFSFESYQVRARYLDALFQMPEGAEDVDDSVAADLRKRDASQVGVLDLDQEMVDELVGDDEVKKRRVDELKQIHEAMLLDGKRVMRHMDKLTLLGVLESTSSSRIVSALLFLAEKDMVQFKDYVRRRVRQSKSEDGSKKRQEAIEANDHISYGLGLNTIFLRLGKHALEKADEWRVVREYHEWGQSLVIDLNFVKHMNMQYVKSLMFRELPFGLKANRGRKEPLAIYFTSYDPNCCKCVLLKSMMQRIMEPDFPAVVSEKSYLDLFPRKNLLYLSPDSRNDLLEYDPDDVYIIGGLIDTSNKQPYSLVEAKKQGIRHARFPCKRVIGMQSELNVDHAIAVISEFKNSKDWFFSFRWVPSRYFKNRTKSGSNSVQLEAIYHAHHQLSPNSDNSREIVNMAPREYKRRYKQLVQEFIASEDGGSTRRRDGTKWNREEHLQKKYGFLEEL